ncbi:MAG TPA: DinB family protein [Candidatus Limnocylindrales bacterium]|nr:DinB family protein [Candidatus Limnocylindrales bacterium]
MSLERYYGDWRRYQELVVRALRDMSAEDLSLRASLGDEATSTHWPIWAIAGHTAGTRVYWLCDVMGAPGAETTPFIDAATSGWEDDLGQPRTADELVHAWQSTWAIVEHVLATWTPEMLDEVVPRARGDRVDRFTRRSLMLRLVTHEAYHVGEIALIQGLHGRPEIDLWPSGWHTVDAGDPVDTAGEPVRD